MMGLLRWFRTLLSGRPHFIIGGSDRPYLLRWWLVPRNPFLNVYLHKFMRDDDDRALHDHPWWFLSLMLRGEYIEHHQGQFFHAMTFRSTGSLAYRPATWRHRVELHRDARGAPVPCWTLVVTGRKVREWGFWCPQGFVEWTRFVDPTDSGQVGPGCNQ